MSGVGSTEPPRGGAGSAGAGAEKGYTVTSLLDLERIPVDRGLEWRPIRRPLGIRAFGVNAYTAASVGDWVVEEHTEEANGHEELYVVVSGHARFTLDGEDVDAPAGTIVFLSDPKVKRVAVAEQEGTTVLAVGGPAGKAFEPSVWEWYFTAYPLADSGELERALEIMREALEEHPDHPAVLYHLACMECRAGRLDDARSHLRRAVELRPTFAEQAREDPDLEAVRDAVSATGRPGA
jgi:tetratricopeptide (TPR) repeat protein